MASLVILHHVYPLSGGFEGSFGKTTVEAITRLSVPGFFVLSGFLVTRSWLRSPSAFEYFKNRFLRIMPGYWVCLLVMALLVGPTFAILGGGLSGYFNVLPDGPLSYLLENSLLLQRQGGINGLPMGVPYPNAINGSLWTLFNEAVCYMVLAAVGRIGLLRRASWTIPLSVPLLLVVLNIEDLLSGHLPNRIVSAGYEYLLFEHLLWFALGATTWLYRERVKLRGSLAILSAAAVALALHFGDLYVILPLPFAYLLFYLAFRLPFLRNVDRKVDLSYGVYIYAFPVQQTLALLGVHKLGVLPFALLPMILVLPLAYLSWRFVEKPALQLKHRFRKSSEAGQVVEGYGTG